MMQTRICIIIVIFRIAAVCSCGILRNNSMPAKSVVYDASYFPAIFACLLCDHSGFVNIRGSMLCFLFVSK